MPGHDDNPAPATTRGQPRRLQRPDGLHLHWVRHGPARHAAEPVLLLHGLASNASRFEEFCEHSTLAQQRALLRVDLRGHGASVSRRALDSETWCDDLAALLTTEQAGRAIVVGHSLGAQVALRLAARHGQHVAGLVLIDPVFRHALHGRPLHVARASPLWRLAAATVRGCNRLGLHRGALPPLDLRAMDRLARQALADPDPAAEARFIARYSSASADLRHLPLAVYLQDLVEMFRPVPAPGTLGLPVLALLSSGATFAQAQAMRQALAGPQVRLETIDCHHWPLTERPAEVRRAIEAWVAERFAPAPEAATA